MKIKPKCIKCELDGAYQQIKLSTDNERLRFKALQSVLDYLSEASSLDITPAEIGTECKRIIREVTSVSDPYSEVKKRMNKTATKLKPIAQRYIGGKREEKKKLMRAIKVAAIGNSFDFSVSEHEVDLSTLKERFEKSLREDIYPDDLEKVASKILSSNTLLYILDNSGEAILDRLLMEKIVESGSELSIAARSAPIQDDITIDMIKELNFSKLGNLFPAGRSTGLNPQKAPRKLQEKLEETDFIISKGQGNFEMLSEYEESYSGRLAYILMTKCEPVSKTLGTKLGSIVVYFLE
ncbi:hypothetical protein AKJ62_04955 [candidate division MSBL1 archaeon SCGC-AAA259D14]|uniref:Damage-control phosphatase ARMT1-like metal-binding domain-containing protein n=4 Tax=candidate division MSBL1 TaxID=215777 RepID=A0A133U2Y4_9EURY|nr:hypothetical protein AKJ62_04955 [candidate division MSBL1 archaeon SCGC-AAA259D14]